MNAPPPLLNVLGTSWELGVPVIAAAWDPKVCAFGFALGDGHLAVPGCRDHWHADLPGGTEHVEQGGWCVHKIVSLKTGG